jgi:hypothetical protein
MREKGELKVKSKQNSACFKTKTDTYVNMFKKLSRAQDLNDFRIFGNFNFITCTYLCQKELAKLIEEAVSEPLIKSLTTMSPGKQH